MDLIFEVIKKADISRNGNGNDIKLVLVGPMALLSNFKLTTSSGKHLEDISHAHIVSLMYKLLTSSRGSNDLSIGLDRDRGRRKDELAQNKNVKSKYHLRGMLFYLFGFDESQESYLWFRLQTHINEEQR